MLDIHKPQEGVHISALNSPNSVTQKNPFRALVHDVRSRMQFRAPRSEVWVYPSNGLKGAPESASNLKQFERYIRPDWTPKLAAELQAATASIPWTLIATVRNELKSVRRWLDSVRAQELMPSELVVSDGGSTDGTAELLEELAAGLNLPFPIRVLQNPGANIAQGRNVAIEAAAHDILLLTDFGCVLDRNWSQLLLLPFADEQFIQRGQAVFGFYRTECRGAISAAFAELHVPRLAGVDPITFLPSARSLGLSKHAWVEVGGFPENLTFAGEDTLFGLRLKERGGLFGFVPSAQVSWELETEPLRLMRKLYRYARGDAEGGLFGWQHYIPNLLRVTLLGVSFGAFLGALTMTFASGAMFWRALAAFIFILVLHRLWCIVWPYRGFLARGKSPREKGARLLVLTLTTIAQSAGFAAGLLSGRGKRS